MAYTHVIHIADVHIRSDRLDEYISVFDRLFDLITQHSTRPLILLCGDIIHQRNRITPEVIKLTNYLLDGLGSIGRTVLINGNHDIIQFNEQKEKFLDVIQKHKNIDYISETMEYHYDNVTLGISTLDDGQVIKYEHIQKKDADLTAAMGHLMLEEVGLPGFDAKVDDFEGYDVVFLGDIHKRKKYGSNCYYSGSILQMNHGEDREKGFGLYNIATKEYEFIDIPNDYSYVTLKPHIKTGELVIPKKHNFSQFTNLRIIRDPRFAIYDDTYIAKVRDLTTITNFTINEYKNKPSCHDDTMTILDIDDDTRIFEELLDGQSNKDQILAEHKRYKQEGYTHTNTKKKFYITKLTFNNVFNYDSEQFLNFEDLNGVIGIIGANASGKSNILRIITFALCGDISVDYALVDDDGRKSSTQKVQNRIKYDYENNHIINKKGTHGYTQIEFLYDNTKYKVKRILKAGSGKDTSTKTTVEFSEEMENRKWERIPSVNKKGTDHDIHKMIGRSTIFLLLNVYNKYTGSLITCSSRERFNILSTLLNLNVYVSIHDKVQEDLKVLRSNRNKLATKKEYINEDVDTSDTVEDIELAEKQINNLNEELEKLYKCYTSNIEPIPIILADTKTLHNKVKKIQDKKTQTQTKIVAIDDGPIKKTDRTENEILTEYDQLKYTKPIEEDVPEISDLPPACRTQVRQSDLIDLEDELERYDLSMLDTSQKYRDKLIGILGRFKRDYVPVRCSESPADLCIDELSKIQRPLKYPIIGSGFKKDIIMKRIIDYKEEDLDILQKEIDEIVISKESRVIHDKIEISTTKEVLEEEINLSFKRIHDFMKLDEIVSDLEGKTPKKQILEKVKNLKNINNILLKVSDDISMGYEKIKQWEADVEHNKCIDDDIQFNTQIKQLKERKHKKIQELQCKYDERCHINKLRMVVKELQHNEYLDSLEPQFIEICRRITFIDATKKYKTLLYKFKQYIAHLSEQQEKYDRLQTLIPMVRYYNEKNKATIHDCDQRLGSINHTVTSTSDRMKEEVKALTIKVNNTKKHQQFSTIESEIQKIDQSLAVKSAYQKLLSRDGGIQSYIIGKYLDEMTLFINSMLEDLVDYKIKLEIQTSSIKLLILKNRLTLLPPQLSGYEGLALDIVSKVAMNKFTQIATSTFFSMDETFDSVDQTNMEKFRDLLQYMKKRYKHILLISHMEEVKELVDTKLWVRNNTIKMNNPMA